MIHMGEQFKDTEIFPELNTLAEQLFAAMPNLEFHATNARHSKVCALEVFSGDQKLGSISWTEFYTKREYVFMYRIYSRKIRKYRGDAHVKKTSSLKSAFKIAKEVFVKDDTPTLVGKVYEAMRREIDSMVHYAGNDFTTRCKPLYQLAFDYTLSVIEGDPQPIDSRLLQEVRNPKLEESRNTHRIAKLVGGRFSSREGVIAYLDREDKLTVMDLQLNTISKLESTYDLPKNYQEKFTILKVMEDNQPIEGTGVKMRVHVDDMQIQLYYLISGDTIVTH